VTSPDQAPSAYFVRTGTSAPGASSGTGFRATEHTAGAWAEHEQHIAPMAGLLVHEIERACAGDGLVLARFGMDILGTIEVADFEVAVEVVRPGRTISLVEARATRNGRTIVVVRAWRMLAQDTSAVAGLESERLPSPDDLPRWDMAGLWPGGFIATLDVRRDPDARPGRARAWVRTPIALVDGEEAGELARWVGLLDTANGMAVRESPEKWLFPNVDLTLHLHRVPVGPWLGLDIRVGFGAEGLGLTESVVHDVHGPVGRLAQVLTVRPRVPAPLSR
jgi:hypothetical protein